MKLIFYYVYEIFFKDFCESCQLNIKIKQIQEILITLIVKLIDN